MVHRNSFLDLPTDGGVCRQRVIHLPLACRFGRYNHRRTANSIGASRKNLGSIEARHPKVRAILASLEAGQKAVRQGDARKADRSTRAIIASMGNHGSASIGYLEGPPWR